jgi:ATP-binding cassette subfamily A (ABC1) protein 3
MVREVGLREKVGAFTSSLSGGQKRKLSVGIALLGDSRIVVLDEPTSVRGVALRPAPAASLCA